MKTKSLLLASSLIISAVCQSVQAADQDKAPPVFDKGKNSSHTQILQSMHGYVSTTAPQEEIAGCIDEALSTAIERSGEAQQNHKQVRKYSRVAQKAWKVTKCTVNYMLDDRGFLPSIEGGQLMLDENLKVHDKASAECAKQLWLDHTHDKVVADIVEMVTALGISDAAKKQDLLNDSMASLRSYDGEETAKHIYDRISRWSEKETLQNAARTFDNDGAWTVKERQNKVDMIVTTVSKSDPIVNEVTKRVHKYSMHGKAATASSQVVETALNVCSLTPTFAGPAAQAALLLFSVGTGGFEEDKLLAEMYLGKRFQSRKNSFNNQALMAIDAYQLAMQTHNIPLASCSASLIKRLGGDELWNSVCQKTALSGNASASPVPTQANTEAPAATTPPQPDAKDKPQPASAPNNQISESTPVHQ